jgi:murein L,D-transpeptidase YcbB/YkuD
LAIVLPARSEQATGVAPVGAAADQKLAVDWFAPPLAVVDIIRSKLGDAELRSKANSDDVAALEAFYWSRTGGPLWITDMGFSLRGQQALFEIEKAEDWGLDAEFELPLADNIPRSHEAAAIAELKLNLAILKYARFARGGRLDPSKLSGLFDQKPSLRDPDIVLSEIAAAAAPDAYLRSLHPKHEQFTRLRQALLKARDAGKEANSTAIRRLIVNMERWRWMPKDLGRFYVWSNTPEFMLYVVKEGNTVYADKTQVGTIDDATPVFSADMSAVVFNPEWIAPRSVLLKDLLPRLRKNSDHSILKKRGFAVSYQGKPVNPAKIDWRRVNILDYTFTQKPGQDSNIGKVKFLIPNRHGILLHDTFPARRKVFHQTMRAIGYGCVRMEQPDRFAQVILAEGNGWSASQVKDLWDNGLNSSVSLEQKIPVHFTYFTAVVDERGTVAVFPDLYGLDRKLSAALFSLQAKSGVKEVKISGLAKPSSAGTASIDPTEGEQIVKATWYGNELRGNRTASGERFNPDGLTAAHRSLPFGTCLVVGNPKTGKTIMVRVNDRGPFTRGVTLDLSAGAARAIGMHSTQNVVMKRCSSMQARRSPSSSSSHLLVAE